MTDLRALFDNLVRLEITLWEAVDRRLQEEMDLRLGRAEVLRVVVTTPSCRVQDVARALSITVGAASKLVDRLEAAGLCRRRAHPDDRRASLIDPTEAGSNAYASAEAALYDELAHRLGGLATEELQTLAALLSTARTTALSAK